MFLSSSMTRTEYPMETLLPSLCPDREFDLEDCASRCVVADLHRPLVVACDGIDDGQPEARPPFLAGKIRLEKTVAVPRRDSGPVVAHGYPDGSPPPLLSPPDHHPPPLPP